jgi:hypothetical protein
MASNMPDVAWPDTDAMLIIHQGAVESAVCVLSAKIAKELHPILKCRNFRPHSF